MSAAMELFAVHGFNAVPVPAIAERAGLSVGVIYKIADSKEALSDDIFVAIRDELIDQLFCPLIDSDHQRVAFMRFWTRWTDWITAHPLKLRYLYQYRNFHGLAGTVCPTQPLTRIVEDRIASLGLAHVTPSVLVSMMMGPALILALGGHADPDRLTELGELTWKSIAS